MKNLLYIGNKLATHGYNMTSIETLGPFLESEGFKVRYASSRLNKFFRLFEMILKTFRYAPKSDFVLIDTYSTYNFWYAFIISQLCRILGARYIPKLHGGDLPNRLRKNPRLCRMIFGNAHINIAPSGYLLEAFRKAGFDNILYVPNSIESKNYRFKVRYPKDPKLLWVRSFSPIYNPEMALDVLEQLNFQYPKASLCMVGPEKNGLLEKISAMAADRKLNVSFTGKLSKEEWTTLAEDYDIFINTTHFDNMPVSVIEAMALGLPVVSTNVGGIPYLATDRETALLVSDNDVEGMVAAIEELMKSPLLKDSITRKALNLVQEFNLERVKWKWFEILK